jgi:penicillin-binding protein A
MRLPFARRGAPGRARSRVPRVPSIPHATVRVAAALGLAYVLIAVGLTYWQVGQADALTSDAANPLVQAAGHAAIPGRILDANGEVLAESTRLDDGSVVRHYAERSLGVVVGYRSPVFGTSGVEHAYDADLVGLDLADPVARLLRKFRPVTYSPRDVVLGIDVRLQQQAASLLAKRRGVIVAIEPSTGRILAMVSAPGFDANTVVDPVHGQEAFERLQLSLTTPFLNRATQGRYVPGSVFKIVTAIAGLESGAITPATTYADQPAEEDTGFVVDGFTIRDGHHPVTGGQALDFAQAVEVSCNIWFAHAGLATGGAALAQEASRLGFGAPIPFDLPTAASQVTNGSGADGGFKDRVELANAAYGQAETFVTPLQMALVVAGVANGGRIMEPHLVIETREPNGAVHPRSPSTMSVAFDSLTATTVAEAMQQAVEGRWGRAFAGAAKVPGVSTAGKTGTAQLGGSGEPHSWFVGFAPVAAPTIAVAVIVERGGSGAVQAAPIAGALMSYWLGLSH